MSKPTPAKKSGKWLRNSGTGLRPRNITKLSPAMFTTPQFYRHTPCHNRAVTPLETIAMQLRKWDRRGYLKFRPDPDLWSDGRPLVPVAVSIGTRAGKHWTFDKEGLAFFDGTDRDCRIAYADVLRVHWMAKETEEKLRMKLTPDFDRLIIERIGDIDVAMENLDQAVFPLLRAFESITAANKERH
jgi:hypothetical protein